MRLATHAIFTLGLVAYALTQLHTGLATTWGLAVLAAAAQYYIDAIGHSRNHGYIHRTFITHDAVIGLGTVTAPLTALPTLLLGVPPTASLLAATLSLYSHLALDYLTGNVFVLTRRIHGHYMEYDNPGGNALFIVLGLLLMFLAR